MLPAPAASPLVPAKIQQDLEEVVAAIDPDQEEAQQAAQEAEAKRLREFTNRRQEAAALAGMLEVGPGASLRVVPPTKDELAQILRRRFGAHRVEQGTDFVNVVIDASDHMVVIVQYAQGGQAIQALGITSGFWSDITGGLHRVRLLEPSEEELARTVRGLIIHPDRRLTLVVSDEGLRKHQLRHNGKLNGGADGFGWEIRSESQMLGVAGVFKNTWWERQMRETVDFLSGTRWTSISPDDVRYFYKHHGVVIDSQNRAVHVVPDVDPVRTLLVFLGQLRSSAAQQNRPRAEIEVDENKVRQRIAEVIQRLERDLGEEIQRHPPLPPEIMLAEAIAWLQSGWEFWKGVDGHYIVVSVHKSSREADQVQVNPGSLQEWLDRWGITLERDVTWVNLYIGDAVSDPVKMLEAFAEKMGSALEPLQREYLRYKIAEFRARRDMGNSASSPSGGRKLPPRSDTPSGGETPSSEGQASLPRVSERGATNNILPPSSPEKILHRVIQSIRIQDELERQP